MTKPTSDKPPKALLHLVFGGHVDDPQTVDFSDPRNLDIVGIFPSNAEALAAWRGASQRNVDDAHMKYVLVHLHRMLDDPEHEDEHKNERADDV